MAVSKTSLEAGEANTHVFFSLLRIFMFSRKLAATLKVVFLSHGEHFPVPKLQRFLVIFGISAQ